MGAIVVRDGHVVGRGCNRPVTDHDPTAHAEIQALREAGHVVGNYRLLGLRSLRNGGALCHVRRRDNPRKNPPFGLRRRRPKAGAVHSMLQVLNHPKLNHQVEVTCGVLAARCMDLVQAFFREKRKRAS